MSPDERQIAAVFPTSEAEIHDLILGWAKAAPVKVHVPDGPLIVVFRASPVWIRFVYLTRVKP